MQRKEKITVSAEERFSVKLGKALRDAREAIPMTQIEISKVTGITQSDISRIERGIANPSIGTIERVLKGLGFRIEFSLQKN